MSDPFCQCPMPRSFSLCYDEAYPPYYKCEDCRNNLTNQGFIIEKVSEFNENISRKRKRPI